MHQVCIKAFHLTGSTENIFFKLDWIINRDASDLLVYSRISIKSLSEVLLYVSKQFYCFQYNFFSFVVNRLWSYLLPLRNDLWFVTRTSAYRNTKKAPNSRKTQILDGKRTGCGEGAEKQMMWGQITCFTVCWRETTKVIIISDDGDQSLEAAGCVLVDNKCDTVVAPWTKLATEGCISFTAMHQTDSSDLYFHKQDCFNPFWIKGGSCKLCLPFIRRGWKTAETLPPLQVWMARFDQSIAVH